MFFRKLNIDKKLKWLHISYWTAAIADFIVAILAQISYLAGTDRYVLPMGMVTAVGISWGILLIMADKKPIERMWVLIPTMIVVFLLGIACLHALVMNIVPICLSIPAIIASMAIFLIICLSYMK